MAVSRTCGDAGEMRGDAGEMRGRCGGGAWGDARESAHQIVRHVPQLEAAHHEPEDELGLLKREALPDAIARAVGEGQELPGRVRPLPEPTLGLEDGRLVPPAI